MTDVWGHFYLRRGLLTNILMAASFFFFLDCILFPTHNPIMLTQASCDTSSAS